MKNIMFKTKLLLLTAVAVIGLLIFGAVSYTTLETVRVGGGVANELRRSIELGGDLSPSTLHIGPARLLVYRMLDETDHQKLQEEMIEFQEFEKAYSKSHTNWVQALPEGKLKEIIAVGVHEPAMKYMKGVEEELAPALLRGDKAKAEEIRHTLAPDFEASIAAAHEADELRKELMTQTTERAASAVRNSRRVMAGVGLLVGVMVCGLALMIAHSILRPLGQTLLVLQGLAEGDLRQQIEVESHDEIGAMGAALNESIKIMAQTVRSITDTADAVASASAELSCSATQQARGAQTQESRTSKVAVAMQEMSASVADVSGHSNRATDSSRRAAETANQGGCVVEEALVKMRAIAESVQGISRKMVELGKSSDQIGKIAGVIDEIADQTNLLALNAAIEAARAGDQGRGFAVVADEVRKLAERTAAATKEIAQMIRSVQDETKTAVIAMEVGSKHVEEGVSSTTRAGDSLKQIIRMSEEVGGMISQIAVATTEQSRASEEINGNMEQITQLVKESADGAQQSAAACQDLSRLAAELRNMVGNFKLGDRGSDRSARDQQGQDRKGQTMRRTHLRLTGASLPERALVETHPTEPGRAAAVGGG